jgi:hypothetical protein
MRTLSSTFNSIQKYLFPVLEEEIGKLTEKQRRIISSGTLYSRTPANRQNNTDLILMNIKILTVLQHPKLHIFLNLINFVDINDNDFNTGVKGLSNY